MGRTDMDRTEVPWQATLMIWTNPYRTNRDLYEWESIGRGALISSTKVITVAQLTHLAQESSYLDPSNLKIKAGNIVEGQGIMDEHEQIKQVIAIYFPTLVIVIICLIVELINYQVI